MAFEDIRTKQDGGTEAIGLEKLLAPCLKKTRSPGYGDRLQM